MKLIEAYLSAFIPLQVTQPPLTFYTSSTWFALQMAILHKYKVEGDKEKGELKVHEAELREILRSTHDDINIPLSTVELKVATTDLSEWGDIPDLYDNFEDLVDFTIYEMFLKLRESYQRVFEIVTAIGRSYTVEIPATGFLTPGPLATLKPKIGE